MWWGRKISGLSQHEMEGINMESNEKYKTVIELVGKSELSSLKTVMSGIISIINNPKSSVKDLKEVIQIDPPLSAKVLRQANSVYYSPRNKIISITQALIFLGFDALKELVLNQKVCDIFGKGDLIGGYSRTSLWKHSNAVALLGKLIYRREFRESGENAYAAGLLHDIGIILEDQFLQDKFKQILIKSKNEKINLSEAEQKILGYNHAILGMALLESWELPQELFTSIGCHHNPDQSSLPASRLIPTLFVADYFCQQCGLGYADAPFQNETVFYKCIEELGMTSVSLDLIIKEVREEISKMEDQGLF